MSACPTHERLAAALRGTQPHGDEADLAAHISGCPACQAQLEALAGASGWVEKRAKAHEVSTVRASPSLDEAMRSLDLRDGGAPTEPQSPPKLDFLEPSGQPGMLGRFGPYEVIAHIASGGMGIVLKARDPGLDRIVALKILPPALAANSLARARFVREARAAAAVVHEHVVPIYAVDEAAGLPYLVMQFVKGRSLSERIRATGPLRLEQILRIGAQTAAGLGAAHAQGLIHRDIKPANILLENSVERVKLTDFGLARAADDVGLTRTGEVAGTPEFMAPEQASNETVDHRADLFSFGSVLYAMCTGISPFHATSVAAAIRNVCDKQAPPVHELNPAIPRWLSEIIARLMAKAPQDRFQSAREVRELLERHLARVQHGDLGALPERPKRPEAIQGRRRLAYASAIVILLISLGCWGSRFITHSSGPVRSQLTTTSEVPFAVRNTAGKILGSYAEIMEAIRTVPSSGVIELNWNGSRRMPPVRLAGKLLTFRSGAKFRPVWLHTSTSESALASDAALTLEGIEFQWDTAENRSSNDQADGPPQSFSPRQQGGLFGPPGVALIAVTGASLRVSHCILRLEGANHTRAGLACISLQDVTTCEFADNAFNATPGKAIVWRSKTDGSRSQTASERDGGSLSLSNCAVNAGIAFWMDLGALSRTHFQIARCTFKGPNIWFFPATASAADVEVVAQNNLFAAGTVLRDVRNVSSPSPMATLHWDDRENLFRASEGYIALSGNPRAAPAAASLGDWKKWWKQTNENSREVEVTFASGRPDFSPRARPEFTLSAFKITDLHVVEGPPLDQNEWGRFGADIANVGPASPE